MARERQLTRRELRAINDFEPDEDRWNGAAEMTRVASPQGAQHDMRDQNSTLTWPTAVWPGQQGTSHAGMLTLNALLAPDLPRPALPTWTQWPNRLHVWPGVATLTWSGFGFWAHSEPDHVWFAAGFTAVGIALLALGSAGVAVGNLIARDADSEPPDKAGTRGLLAAGLAAVAGGASTGAGSSGIGWMLTAGTVAVGYGGYFGWQRHNRHQAVQSVIAFAAASNPGPMPPGMPLPPIVMPSVRNPFEARIQGALEAMKIEGTWLGSPQKIAEDVWRFPAELPAGANMSPEALSKKEAVLANNMRARRVTIQPTHGAKFVLDVYDGADRTDEQYPWTEANQVSSIEQPVLLGHDEAAQPERLTIIGRLLVAGAAGGGKSQFLNNLLLSTLPCRDLVRIGIDCKPGAPELGPYEPAMHYLATETKYAMAVLHGVREVIIERGMVLAESSVPSEMNEDGVPVRKWRYEFGPRVAVVLDELAELTRYEPGAAKLLEGNRQLGRFVAVDAWDATQGPSAAAMGGNTDGRQQYDIRVGFQAEGVVNNMVFGQGASGEGWKLEKLDGIGKFLLSATGVRKPHPIKGIRSFDRDVADQVAKWKNRVPDLDERSAEAFERGFSAYLADLENTGGPSGPSGGPGRGQDAIDIAQDFASGRPFLSLVPTYPGTSDPIDAKHQALWNLLGEYGAEGAFVTELVTYELKDFKSESNVRKQMKVWERRGYVVAAKDGRADRFARVDMQDRGDRKEA